MTPRRYTTEEQQALAQQIAYKYGCEVIRWWPHVYDPRHVYIEVTYRLPNGDDIRCLKEAWLEQPGKALLYTADRSAARSPHPGSSGR